MAEIFLSEDEISVGNENSGIEALLRTIKPSWNLDHLQNKLMSGGYSSRIFRCYVKDNEEDSVVIRVRNLLDKGNEKKFQNSEGLLELKALHYVSSIGHFPKIHAIFQNGYCYQFIKGKPMINVREKTGYVDDKMLRAIAEEMAFVHSIKLEGVSYSDKNIFKHIAAIVESLDPVKFNHNGISNKVMLKEFELITNFVRSKKYKTVFCHGDPHPGNYIWDEEQGKLTVVDWEISHIGYQMTEIAQFFITIDLMIIIFSRENAKKIIKDDYKQKLVRYYLEAWKKQNNDNSEVTENEMVQWMEDITTVQLIPEFLFVLFGYMFPDVFVEFAGDISIHKDIILRDYFNLKEKAFGKTSFETE